MNRSIASAIGAVLLGASIILGKTEPWRLRAPKRLDPSWPDDMDDTFPPSWSDDDATPHDFWADRERDSGRTAASKQRLLEDTFLKLEKCRKDRLEALDLANTAYLRLQRCEGADRL